MPFPDPTRIDLTNVDLRDLRSVVDLHHVLETDEVQRAAAVARDALYIAVGLGVLGVQRAQVRRREIERSLRRVRHERTDR